MQWRHFALLAACGPHAMGQQGLNKMLHAAIENADLSELHRAAESIRQGQAEKGDSGRPHVSASDLESLMGPDMYSQMLDALSNATDASASLDDRVSALEDLQELVEDIDNARDFMSVGEASGYSYVLMMARAPVSSVAVQADGSASNAMGEGDSGSGALQVAATWILGTAAQNNPELQQHLQELGVLPILLQHLRASETSAALKNKALYALSALVRGSFQGQRALEAEGGVAVVMEAVQAATPSVLRKALVLLTDLAREVAGEHADGAAPPAAFGDSLRAAVAAEDGPLRHAVLACLTSAGLDTREKGVTALRALAAVGLPLAAAEVRAAYAAALRAHAAQCEHEDCDADDAAAVAELLAVLTSD